VFAFSEDRMGVPGYGPAAHINANEFARRLRTPSRLPRISESSQCAPNALERAGTGKESIEPLDVRSSPGDETSIVNAKDPRALDVDDFRRWWRQRLIQEAPENRSQRRIPTRVAIALAGIALIGSALALKGGAPVQLNGSRVAPLANDTARAQTAAAADARNFPVNPASGPVNGAVGTGQPSFNLPAKHPVAAIPSAPADTPNAQLPVGTAERPKKEASGAKALQRLVESVTASATPAEAHAAGSTRWVVQLGAPRSEAEAKKDLKRLKTEYGSVLNGTTVSLHKVLVNGETVYRLHVVGLSRDKAAALCSRVKGDSGSCFIVR
jgi:cell division septation protein DedD